MPPDHGSGPDEYPSEPSSPPQDPGLVGADAIREDVSVTIAVRAAQEFLRRRLAAGGIALDATAGQGYDTAFLARLLGRDGTVHACDIQSIALTATQRRWEEIQTPKASLQLHLCGHEEMPSVLHAAGLNTLNAIMFNLGYMPGGAPQRTTHPTTTRTAIESLLPFLAPSGVMTVVGYPGHPGGREELKTVLDWAVALPETRYHAHHVRPLNQGDGRPELIAIERLLQGSQTRDTS